MIKIVSSRRLWNLSVELVIYYFINHILTNSTDIVPINSFYRPVCDGFKAWLQFALAIVKRLSAKKKDME